VNHKQNAEERKMNLSNSAIASGWNQPIVVNEVPQDFVDELKKSKEETK
jgi:hypothetical protein